MPEAHTTPYRDPGLDLETRVEDLLGRMDLDEKLAQLGCVWSTTLVENEAFSPAKARERLHHGTGHITRIGASTGLRPRASAAFANAIQRYLRDVRFILIGGGTYCSRCDQTNFRRMFRRCPASIGRNTFSNSFSHGLRTRHLSVIQ